VRCFPSPELPHPLEAGLIARRAFPLGQALGRAPFTPAHEVRAPGESGPECGPQHTPTRLDPAFADRYEAFEHYDKALNGEVALEGGWRVYSSGAGISVRLITQCFLGIRQESAHLVIDPVIPAPRDGLSAALSIAGRPVEIIYHIKARGCGVVSIDLNGDNLEFTREGNPYRSAAARLSLETVLHLFTGNGDRLTVSLE